MDTVAITVTPTVPPVNDAPVNTVPAAQTVAEDSTANAIAGISVADIDSATLTVTLSAGFGALAAAASGSAVVTGGGAAALEISGAVADVNATLAGLTYTPNADFFGDDTLTVATSDGALSDVDTVAITVTPVNDAPTAASAAAETQAGVAVSIVLPFSDVDNTAAALALSLPPLTAQGGAVIDNGDGSVTYTPAGGFSGVDSFTYFVTDPEGLVSSVETVTVLVGDVATPPTVQSAQAFDITIAGGLAASVVVTYADDVALDVASFDVSDIVVSGPGGALAVTGFSVSPAGDGSPRTVSYTLQAAGGVWDASDNGVYTVSLVADQVLDTSGFAAAAIASLTSFTVSAPPAATLRVEAEDFVVQQGFATNALLPASGGVVLQASGSGEQIATHVFAGAAGIYDLSLGYFDENDGAASIRVLVNGNQVDAFTWSQDLGSPLATYATTAQRAIAGVTLRPGDVVELRGFGEGAEPLRTDYLDFAFQSALPTESFRVEAEAFSLDSGFVIKTRAAASNGAHIEAVDASEHVASYVFAGIDGIYDLGLGHFDENDGVAAMRVLVNGEEVDNFLWNLTTGSPTPTAQSLVERAIPGVTLHNGDIVELRGFGGKGEPLRTDYLDFDRVGDIPPPPPTDFRVEAETLTIVQGFAVEEIGPQASGGSVLRATGAGEQIASYAFAAAPGVYDLAIGYFDENDGTASLRVLRNGSVIDSFIWNQDLGSPLADPSTATVRQITGVTLALDDVIEIRGFGDNPDGSANEPLRTDYIDFSRVGDAPTPPAPLRVEAEDFVLVQGLTKVARGAASGGFNIEGGGSGEKIARHVFTGVDGIYDLGLGYFDENDAVASMRVLVNDIEVDAFAWDADTGSAFADATSRVERTIADVALRTGDTVELRGFAAPGEPLRTDYLDFVWVDQLVA